MAIQFYNGIDLNKNELVQARVENQPNNTAAGTGVEGQIYFDSTEDALKVWAGGAWVEVGGGIETIIAGDGLTGSSLSGPTATIHIDYGGAGNIIDAAGGSFGIAGADRIIFEDASDSVVKEIAVSSLLALAPQGDITRVNITAGAGLSGTTVDTTSGDHVQTLTVGSIANGGITVDPTGLKVDSTVIRDFGAQSVGGLKTFTTIPLVGTAPTADDSTKAASTAWVKNQNYVDSSGVTSINFKTDGTALNVDSNTVTSSGTMTGVWQGTSAQYVNGSGDLVTFPNIPQGDITGLDSGDYISITDATGPVPTIDVLGTIASTPSRLVARDASGYGYVDTPASGDSSEKIATTAFVQNSLTGLLEFKGGFNASTGAIVGGGNLTSGGTRVAVAVGDYYVVTVAGNFFGNSATPLTPGDSVMVQTAAAAGASVEGDFIVVQSDTDLATNSTVGLMYINPSGSGISSNIAAGKATLTNTDKGSSQNIFKNVASDSGTAVADNNNDTLTIAGGTNVTTSVTGDTLTITSTDTNTQRSAGTGLSLSGNTINANVAGTQTALANAATTTTGRTYKVQVDSGDNLVVNIPWENTDSGGTVTSVSATHEGNAFSVTVGTPTSTPAIDIDVNGTSAQYINGLGNLVTFPAIPQGDITAVNASTANNRLGIGVTSSTGPIPVVGLSINTLSSVVPASADSIPIYDASATTNKRATVENLAKSVRQINSGTVTIATPAVGSNTITYPFTLANLEDIMIQLIDTVTNETIEAVVDRTSTTQAVIKFGTLPPNPIKVLLQRIG